MEQSKNVQAFKRIASNPALIIEIAILAMLVPLGCYLAIRFSSGTKYWDDLLYIHTSWNFDLLPEILNRYFLVYLGRLFILIANNDPITGAKLFGGFTFSVILILVYLNARIMAKNQKQLIGVLAVLLLLTFSPFVDDFGVVMADFVVTMMILLGVLLFNLFWILPKSRNLLLFLFGLVLILSLKSKESGIFLCLLVPAFFVESNDSEKRKQIGKFLLLLTLGVLSGVVLFIILDGLLLKDPFFSLRPGNIHQLLSFNTSQNPVIQKTENNFLYYFASSPIFLLALAYVFATKSRENSKAKWLVAFALGIIFFLSLSIINGGWGIVPRYLTPAAATLAIVASQIPAEESPFQGKNRWIYLAIVVSAILLAGGIPLLLYISYAKPLRLTFEFLLSGVIIPLVLILLLAWLVLHKSKTRVSYFLVLSGILLLAFPTSIKNLANLYDSQKTAVDRFLPLAEFKESISCSSGNILISKSVWENGHYLGRDLASNRWMYDIFLKCHTVEGQFTFSQAEDIVQAFDAKEYAQAFLTSADMQRLRASVTASQALKQYTIQTDTSKDYYYLWK